MSMPVAPRWLALLLRLVHGQGAAQPLRPALEWVPGLLLALLLPLFKAENNTLKETVDEDG
jgi:hypothetical protein